MDKNNLSSSRQNEAAERTAREIEEILRRVDAHPIVDSRTESEILGYDESGVSRDI